MSNPPTDGSGRLAEIRALNRHLVSAEDAKILKVVAMVDALPQRGQADALIAPLRLRLAQLRPRRPLSGVRLLFMPLDPVLVPAPRWRRGAMTVPRTVIEPLVRQLDTLEPGLVEAANREVQGFSTVDHVALARVGMPLWARASALLAGTPPPAEWAEATGLGAEDHRALRDVVVLVLRHGPATARQAFQKQPNAEAIAGILSDAASMPDAMGVLVSVLLHWVPGSAGQVLAATSARDAPAGVAGRAATERAVEQVLERIEAEQDTGPEGMAALPALQNRVELLHELEAHSVDRPTRLARIGATRAKLEGAVRARFQKMVDEVAAGPLAHGMPDAPEAVAALESAARDIRRFETMARRISGSDHYDRQLRGLMDGLAPRARDDNETRVERLRLAEILLGSERALQMLMATEKA